jgi:type II secretory pathway pseudopilin PulG
MQVSLNHPSQAGAVSARHGERSLAAFSIIEVLIGMGIVAFLFLALYGAFSSGFSMIQIARENLRATQVLMEKMETIRVYNWDQVTSTNFLPTAFTNYYFPPATNAASRGVAYVGRVRLSAAPVPSAYADDMRQLTVEITWTSRGQARTRTMTTFVSKHGIQNYRFL